ncbi:hypothetical protein BJV78DRAFT_700564 [Lactifluus subvellereus]|nr:hypothetical protein BJV78DRAFT_700564 [Lactifluus subvellereus]
MMWALSIKSPSPNQKRIHFPSQTTSIFSTMVSTSANPDERLPCPWPGCNKTIKPGRSQDLERHMGSIHLPFQFFCSTPSCSWRGGRRDEFITHRANSHPGDEHEPGVIYDIKLILDHIKKGVPIPRVEGYALDFVAERALELGKVEEWEDLCGRRARAGWCRCEGQHA